MHCWSLASIVMSYRILPARVESFAKQAGWLPMARWQRRGNLVIAVGFALLSTSLMVKALANGPPMTLVAAAELLLAATWLAFLVTRSQGPRRW
jgi:hypothetical protein